VRKVWRRAVGFLFSIGEYPHESEAQRAKRRIFVGAVTIATILTIPVALDSAVGGYTLVALLMSLSESSSDVVFILIIPLAALMILGRWAALRRTRWR